VDTADPRVMEAVARALYARWCADCDTDDTPPDWAAFESGADLNPIGLKSDSFREDAEFIMPYDGIEPVARRICWSYCLCDPKACHSTRECFGWGNWIKEAEAVMAAVREQIDTV
jgi:hypothetical protein